MWNVAWHPMDRTQLATVSTDGMVRIFETDFREVLQLARAHKNRNLTEAERHDIIEPPVFGTLHQTEEHPTPLPELFVDGGLIDEDCCEQ